MIDSRFTKILFTQKQLEKKIKELAQWVNETYKNSENLILVGILKGSFPFLAQLIKNIKIDYIIDFMTISTYESKKRSTGNYKIIMDLKNDINNKDVLIVEDIIDSGFTLSKTILNLQNRSPKSIQTLALLDKTSGRKVQFQPDKYGFKVPNKFLVGFGLDVEEKLRGLPYIGIWNLDKKK